MRMAASLAGWDVEDPAVNIADHADQHRLSVLRSGIWLADDHWPDHRGERRRLPLCCRQRWLSIACAANGRDVAISARAALPAPWR
jgi:hypothetical protein